jgi:hypothetical protein
VDGLTGWTGAVSTGVRRGRPAVAVAPAREPTVPAALRFAAARVRVGVPTAALRLAVARGARVAFPRLLVLAVVRAALRLLSGLGPEVLAGALADGAAGAGCVLPAVSRAACAVASGATAELLRGGVDGVSFVSALPVRPGLAPSGVVAMGLPPFVFIRVCC